MAKIDISQIDGYETMTAEEKLNALEEFEIAEPDYKGYIKKELFDKTASELAKQKKLLQSKLTEDETKQQAEQEAREKLQADYDKLVREVSISKNKAELLGIGYEDSLADETAIAMFDGDTAKVFENQRKHIDAVGKKLKADLLKETPKPEPDGEKSIMTKEKLKGMTPMERYIFSVEHKEEYNKIYGGNE